MDLARAWRSGQDLDKSNHIQVSHFRRTQAMVENRSRECRLKVACWDMVSSPAGIWFPAGRFRHKHRGGDLQA